MRFQSSRRLLILSGFLFFIATISLVAGLAFNGSNSRSPQVQSLSQNGSVKALSSRLSGISGRPNRLGPVKVESSAVADPFRSAFSFNEPFGSMFTITPPVGIVAVKSASLGTDVNGNGFVNPGDTLMYSVVVSNSGPDATNVVFSDTLDPNLTLVGTATASPIAAADAYSVLGNVGITVPAVSGLLINDINPQGSGTLSITAVPAGTTLQGGSFVLATDGSFSYNPPVGFQGTDSFTYTLNHSNGKADTDTVSLAVSGMIWFVNTNGGACSSNCNGRLSNPFTTLASFITANNAGGAGNPGNNDNIFVYESAAQYSGALTLRTGQKLIGQDATASLVTIAGVTVPLFSNALPAMNSANGTITNIGSTVTLNTTTVVRGLQINSTTSTGLNDPAGPITGVSVSEVSIATTTGTAVLLSSVDTSTFAFRSISSNGAANGISLTTVNTTSGSFTVDGDGTNTSAGGNSSGGTIANATGSDATTNGIGVYLNNTKNITLRRMTINGTNQNFGIRGFSVNNFTMEYSTISGTNGTSATENEGSISFGANTGEPGGPANGLTGSATFTSCNISGGFEDNLRVANQSGSLNRLTLTGNSITNTDLNNGNDCVLIEGESAATINVTATGNTISGSRGTLFAFLLNGNNTADLIFNNNIMSNPPAYAANSGSNNLTVISGANVASGANTTFHIQGNTFRDSNGPGVLLVKSTDPGTFSGTFTSNQIGVAAVNDSGSFAGSGVKIQSAGAGTVTVAVTNNQIRQYNNFGIEMLTGGSATAQSGAFNATVTGNTVSNPGTQGLPMNGIHLNGGTVVGDTYSICTDIGGAGGLANSITGSGANGGTDVRVRQRQSTTVRLPGYGGANNDNTAVQTYLSGRNGAGSALASNNVPTGGGFVGGAACVAPSTIAPRIDADEQKAAPQQGGSNNASLTTRAKNWLRPMFSAFASSLSYVNLDKAFSKVEPTVAAAESEGHAQARAADAKPAIPAKTMIVNSRGEARIVPTASLTAMAGETVTINGGGGGFTLPSGKSVTIMFNATIAAAFTGTAITNQATITATSPVTNVTSNNLSTPVIQAPNFSKAFSPMTIATNTGVSTLTFTLVNPNPSQALSAVAFTDGLPSGVEVAATPAVTTSGCGAPTFAPAAAATTLNFSGGSIAAGATCTVSVNVRGTTEGVKPNTSSTAASTQANPSGTASATLNVLNAPTFSKAFGASTVALNGTTSLTFTITNNSAITSLNGIGFTDTLPAGLVVATPNGLSTTCSGTPSATQNTSTVSLTGATLATSASCTLTVNVTGTTAGAKPNSATLATAELGASSATTGTVTLTVFAPPTIAKAFSPTSIFVGGTFSQLTFTITNPNASGTLTGVGFSDNFPGGLQVDTSPGVVVSNCGGGTNTSSFTAGATSLTVSNAAVTASTPCTIKVNVIGTTAGAKPNTTGAITSAEGGTGTVSNTATLNVFTAPQIAKSFGASAIPVGGTTTVTFTITNPAANPGALTTITFIDSLPAGMVVVNPPVPTNTCGGSVTAVNSTGTISLGGASIPSGSSCQVQATVMGTTAGVKNNSVTVSSGNGGTGNTANASLTVANPPTLSKAFSPSLITPGGTSTLTITLTNPNATVDLTPAALTDTLPAGVTTVNSTAATTCGGTASQTSNSVSLSGGTIPQGGSCTLSVNVTSATNNVYTNTIAAGALTTNAGANASPASATLTVASPPTISKAFAPNSILSGGTSTLTITLTNPNSNVPLTLSSPLVDTLPVGVTTVAATAANTCGGTSSQASGSVTLTGGTIPAGGSCTLSVNVTSTNTGGNINTIAAGALVTNGGTNANPATATLVVGIAPAITKSFSPSAIKTGATSTMTIAITNNNAGLPFNGVSFTDTLPAGLTVPDAGATSACGGTLTVASNVITLTGATIAAAGGVCTTTFTVTGATVGVKTNTVTVDTTNFGTGFTGTGTITVYDPPTIAKSFSLTSIPFGGTSLLTFTLTNPNAFAGGGLSGLAFTDTLPAGMTQGSNSVFTICGGTMTLSAPSTVSFSGGALGTSPNSCTINVSVTGTQIGMWPNTTGAISSTQTGAGATSNTATLTVMASPTTTTITNSASLNSTPTVVGQSYAVNVTVAPSGGGMGTPGGTVNVADGTGATCSITLSGGSGTCNLTSTSVGAPKTISANYVGDGNFGTSSATASHTVNKANTTLSNLTDAPDPSVVGQPYTAGFTLNVTAPGAGTPTGTVSVNDGAGGSCTATLPATSCQLTSIVPGNKTVTFTYNGDANFNASPSNTAGHGVNMASTTVAITNDTPDPSVIGQNYAVTAAVSVTSPGSGTPTGTITVTDGTNNCTITLPATSCNLPSTSVGAKTLTATYNGDSNFNGSGPSAGAPHTVNKADVVVTITSDNPDSSALGQNVTVAFTVAAAAPGAGTPTGNVTITVSGGAETCTGALAAGSGSCTLALTVAGSRMLTATYNGDTNFNGGTDTEPHTVVAPPSISKGFSPMTAPLNTITILTFTITNPAANTVTLTGVTFTDSFPGSGNLVVANPLTTTNTCGGTLTNDANGVLAAGNNGIKLTGGTVAINSTCTVSVNVTPLAQGPFVNLTGVVGSANGGPGNMATATLLTNTPPTISAVAAMRQQGSPSANSTIANVNDVDQAANTLSVTVNGVTSATVNGVMVSNITVDAAGVVKADIVASCNAMNAAFTLRVTDSGGLFAETTLNVTVTANTAPTVGNYAATSVLTGGGTTVTPSAAPADNGTIAMVTATASPNTFTGSLVGNTTTGTITITNAAPAGNYTITVTVKDNCGAEIQKTLSLKVNTPPTIASVATSRQQGSPSANSTIANVNDVDQAANTLSVTVNGGTSATVNGVTVSNIAVSAAGVVTADVVATCTATNANFTLRVTDSLGDFAEATLNVTVSANTPPVLSYAALQNVIAGNGLTVNPATGPSDNGTVSTIIVQSKGTFTGNVAVNAAGVVTISNAGPAGSHTITIRATDNCGAETDATFTLAVSTLTGSVADPALCTGPGGAVDVTATVTNGANTSQAATLTASLPAGLLAVPGTCSANVGTCNVVNGSTVSWSGTLAGNQTVTIKYKAQIGDQVTTGTQLCITSSATVGASPAGSVVACLTVNCPALGTGAIPDAKSPASDQKAGSVLFYNIYSSDASSYNSQNTRVSITNVHPVLKATVHIFFVDGVSCTAADMYVCLTPNQTYTFLASDIDPGTTGYLVAVAVDDRGCPIDFNYLIGDEYVKFSSGHAANLGAEAISALAGGLPLCDGNSTTATLNFDGVSYNGVPRVLAVDNLPAKGDGNDTMLIINRFGGNLSAGGLTLGTIFGLLYDDVEQGYSFNVTGGCQLRNSLSNSFPRTAPRFESAIPPGRTGWMKLYSLSENGMFGAMINLNKNSNVQSGAFNQGHNLHKLTLTQAATLIIPVFPPRC